MVKSNLRHWSGLLFLVFTSLASGIFPVYGQGTARITISGVPSVLQTPYLAELQRDYQAGRFPVQFVYSHASRQPGTFRFALSLSLDGQELVSETSQEVTIRPGVYTYRTFRDAPEILFPNIASLIGKLPSDIQTRINQTGLLPEGRYELTLEALSTDPEQFVVAPPASVFFTVSFPEAPVLLSPSDEAVVTQAQPIFTWLPVLVPSSQTVEYQVRLVEILPGQTTDEAFRGNRAHLESAFQRGTSFVYGRDLLPLETGKRYAWNVKARTISGAPIAQGGQSEIYTFSFGSGSAPDDVIAQLRQIVLEPGLATLTGLTDLVVTDEGSNWLLNGLASLNLTTPSSETITVNVENIRLQKGSLEAPVLQAGSVTARPAPDSGLLRGASGGLIDVRLLRWEFGRGFIAEGALRLPNGNLIPATGSLRFSRSGFSGEILSESSTSPIFTLGIPSQQLVLNRIRARFPETQLSGSGRFSLNGTTCALDEVLFTGGMQDLLVDCALNETIRAVPGSDLVQLQLNRLQGRLRFDTGTGRMTPELTVNGQFAINVSEGRCMAGLNADLTESGWSIRDLSPACNLPSLPLGLFDLSLSNLRIPLLAFDTAQNRWDFAIDIDGQLTGGILGTVRLPRIAGIRLTPEGFSFPSTVLTGVDLSNLPELNFGVLKGRLTALRVPVFTLNAFDLTTAAWQPVLMDFAFRLADDLPLPACLQAPRFNVRDFRFTGNSFNMDLGNLTPSGCEIPLGMASLRVNQFGGQLEGALSSGRLNINPNLLLGGSLRFGSPFTCDGIAETILPTSLGIDARGRLVGNIENIVPSCPLNFGFGSGSLRSSNLILGNSGGIQTARLEASAGLDLSLFGQSGVNANGLINIDLIAGRFSTFNFNLLSGFNLPFPTSENPFFTFRLNGGLNLSQSGLRLTGTHAIQIGADNIPVRFDRGLFDLNSFRFTEGVAQIGGSGAAFQLAYLLNEGRFTTFPASATLPNQNLFAIRVESVNLTPSGFAFSGNTTGQLRFGGESFGIDRLQLRFTDFTLGTEPIAVSRGQLGFFVDGSRVATFDAAGFRLEAGGLLAALPLPEQLPLPRTDLAFLRLRSSQGGPLLIATEDLGGGRLRIFTRPGNPIQLVLAGLNSGGTPPSVGANFDLVLNNGDFAIQEVRSFNVATSAEVNRTLFGSSPLQLTRFVLAGVGSSLALHADVQMALPTDLSSDPLVVRNLRLSERGFEEADVSAIINLPDRTTGTLRGRLSANGTGLSGFLGLEQTFTLGNNPLQVALSGLRLQFPSVQLVGSGALTLFGGRQTCGITDLVVGGTEGMGSIDCRIDEALQLVPGSSLATLNLGRITGRLGYAGGRFIHDLLFTSQLGLEVSNGPRCGTNLNLRFTHTTGLTTSDFRPDCSETPRLNLGALEALLANLRVPSLQFNPTTGHFDFEIQTDLQLAGSLLGTQGLPSLPGIRIRPNGITFPDVNFNSVQLSGLRPFDLGGIQARVSSFSMRGFTLDWFGRSPESPGNWDAQVGLNIGLGNVSEVPRCLQTTTFPLSLNISGSRLSATLPVQTLRDCSLPLGPASLELTGIGGSFTAGFESGRYNFSPVFSLSGNLRLSDTFTCMAASTMPLGTAALNLLPNGLVLGNVTANIPETCSLQFGPFQASVGRTTLSLGRSGDNQTATLDGIARLTIGDSAPFDGTYNLNLFTGRFNTYRFALSAPFVLAVPPESPVFRFNITSGELSNTGFNINGINTLDVGGSQIRAIFDNVRLNLSTLAIENGQIQLDAGMGLEAGIGSGGSLRFSAVNATQPPAVNPGIMLRLGSTITIDRTGLSLGGRGSAALNYRPEGGEALNLPRLDVDFGSGFSFNFSPFSVGSGRANLLDGSAIMGYIDRSGLQINPGYVVSRLLPERLPLPSETVAYLQLRRGGTALVETTTEPGGRVRLAIKRGETVNLVFPAMARGGRTPEVPVTFTDVVFDPALMQITGGSISADVSGLTDFILPDHFPLQLRNILYGERTISGRTVRGLFLTGNLRMFSENWAGDCPAAFQVLETGRLSGSLACTGINQNIPLPGVDNFASLRITGVNGAIDLALPGVATGTTTVNFGLDGQINLNSDGREMGRLGFTATLNNGIFTLNTTADGSQPGGLPRLDFGSFGMGITHLRDLSLSMTGGALQFGVGADLDFRIRMPNGTFVTIPANGAYFGTDGFRLPSIQLAGRTLADLGISPITLGPIQIQPTQIRIPSLNLGGLRALGTDLLAQLVPSFDLNFRMPSVSGLSRDLATTNIAFNNVTFRNGVFTGTLGGFDLPGNGLVVPFGTDAGLQVRQITARFFDDTGRQGVDVRFNGGLQFPSAFGDTRSCSASLTAALSSTGDIAATASGIAPCGSLTFGPLSLRFTRSDLALTLGSTTAATLEGTAEATLRTPDGQVLNANGDLGINLLNGSLTRSNILLNGPFVWQIPSDHALLSFTINSARLNTTGLTFDGAGQLDVPGAPVGVRFNAAQFGFDGRMNGGSIAFNAGFGFDIPLGEGTSWRLTAANAADAAGNFFRLNLPTGLSLDPTGLLVNGTASARINYGTQRFTESQLSLNFAGFRLGLTPFGVSDGRVDLNTQDGGRTVRIAYFDRDGFHPDNLLAALPLPARLPLPDAQLAYLQLRDSGGALLIETADEGSGRMAVRTRPGAPINFVIPALRGSNPSDPTLPVQFDFVLNTGDFTVREVRSFVANGAPILNAALFGAGSPIALQRFDLTGNGAGLALLADLNITLPTAISADPLSLRGIRINQRGFEEATINATLNMPGGTPANVTGLLRGGLGGLTGELLARADGVRPILRIGSQPIEAALTELRIQFPDVRISGNGGISLMNGVPTCAINNFTLSGETNNLNFSCSLGQRIQLVPGSALATLGIASLSGDLTFNARTNAFGYNLNASGDLAMQVEGMTACGASLDLSISNTSGFSARNVRPNCSGTPQLNLGFLNMGFRNLNLPTLTFNPVSGRFSFELAMDANLTVPTFNNLQLPQLSIRLTESGIRFNPFNYNETDLSGLGAFNLGFAQARITGLRLATPFTFNWFAHDSNTAGNWDFAFDLRMNLPSGPEFPACLQTSAINLNNLRFSGTGVSFNSAISAIGNGGCNIPMGPATLKITELSAQLSGSFNNHSFNLVPTVQIAGGINLGTPFTCSGAPSPLSLGATRLNIGSGGLVQGRIDNLAPSCPLQFGTYTASVNRANLIFGTTGGRQTVLFDGGASLTFAPGQSVSGTFELDVANARFNRYSFNLDNPFDWAVPATNPVFTFRINRARLDQNGLLIDGRNNLRFGDGAQMGVTFDQFLFNLDNASISSGSITFDTAFSLQAGINETTNQLAFSAAALNAPLTLSPGAMLKLTGAIRIDRTGLGVTGSTDAALRYRDWNLTGLGLTYSNDFRLSFSPFGITAGNMTINHNGSRVATISSIGIAIDPAFVLSVLPDRLPVPHVDVAYLELRRSGRLMVDMTTLPNGNLRINTQPGQTVNMVIPALRGSGSAPSLAVTFSNFEIDPRDFRVVGGYFSVRTADVSRIILPANFPLQLTDIGYGIQNYDGSPLAALFLTGTVRLFESNVPACNLTTYIQMDGRLRGNSACRGMDANIPLVGSSNLASLQIRDILGSINVPLTGGSPSFSLDINAGFRIRTRDEVGAPIAAELDVQAQLSETGFRLTGSMPRTLSSPPTIDMGIMAMGINRISSLTMAYTAGRFTFRAGLDVRMRFGLEEGRRVELPSYNIEISDSGLHFAAIDLHSGSTPPLNLDPFTLGPVAIDLLAFRMSPMTVDFFSGRLSDFNPRFDLEVTLPGFRATAPELANARISLNNAGLQDGNLVGTIIPYIPEGGLLRIPMGGSVRMNVTRIEGSLLNNSGTQGFNFQLTTELEYPNLSGSGPACRNPISLGFNGTTFTANASLAPCGSLNFDPVTLRFTSANLDLTFGGTPRAEFRGTAEATIRRDGMGPATATGTLGLNLLTGEVFDANISITGPFTWSLPSREPVFSFTVNSAGLNQDGITFNGAGNLRVGTGSIGVRFNSPHFRFRDMALTSGDITLDAAIAFDIGLGGGSSGFQLVSPSTPVPTGNFFRLGLPSSLRLDATGMTISGAATAQLRFGPRPEDFYNSLSLNFVGFTMNYAPVAVSAGRADIMLATGGTTTRLAYFDRDGFHPDNIAGILPIPARLGLPNQDVAYLQLRSGPSNSDPLLIQTQDMGSGRLRIFTRPAQPIQVVFAGFAGAPSAGVELDMTLNTSDFSVVSVGTFNVTITEQLNQALFGNFPVAITALGFSGSGSGLVFQASARINLPESLSRLPLDVENLRITSSGFESATVRIGTYSASYQPACESTPVQQASFSDGAVVIAACGIEMVLGSSGISALRFSGQLGGTFLQNNTGAATRMHLTGEVASGNWSFVASGAHLPSSRINLGFATLEPTRLALTANATEFAVTFDGTFRLPSIGTDFAISVTGLKVGTAGVSITSAVMTTPQTFNLFNNSLVMNVNRLALLGPGGGAPFRVQMSGAMNFMGQTGINFTDFTIGTDGSVSLGSGDVNFLAGRPINIIDQVFALNELRLGYVSGAFTLRANGNVTLPAPMSASSAVSVAMTVNPTTGAVTIPPTTVSFTLDATGRRNGSPLELTLGSFATIEPTGVQLTIDWQRPAQTTFYASGNVYVQNDNAKIIEFGRPTDLTNQYGIRVTFGGSVDWRLTNTPSFTFDTDFFSIQIAASMPTTSGGWQLVINGVAGLKIPGVAGARVGFADLTIDRTGIVNPGRFTGEFQAQLMGIATLSLGSFTNGTGNLTYRCEGPGSTPQNPVVQDCTVDTQSYMLFNGVQLSLGSTFSGGVEQVMYYIPRAGGIYLRIKNFNVSLNGVGNLTAHMEFTQSNGDFLLRAAGGGTITSLGGSGGVGFAFMGKFANKGGQLSFGMFAYISVPIPLYPGIVTLTGVGAGFFYRPENEDIRIVTNIINFTPMRPLPSVEGMTFAILLAADAGFVGTHPVYAVSVRTLFMFAAGGPGGAWAISINARGTVFGQSQERLNIGFFLNLEYSPTRFSMAGGVEVVVNYPSIVTGRAEVNFSVIKAGTAETVWAINGSINDFRIISIITVNGRFVVTNSGFLFDLSARGGFNFWIVAVNTSFDLSVWWNKPRDSFGAYVRMGIEASVLGGLASLSANAEGAFIREGPNYLIYAAASGRVKVIFVFEGTIRLWIACRNGSWDGGMGSDERYRQMIEDARNQAAEMEQAADEAAGALQQAQNAPQVFALSEAQLTAAGALLQSYPQSWRASFAAYAVNRERDFYNVVNTTFPGVNLAFPPVYQRVVEDVIEANRADLSTASLSASRTQMTINLSRVTAQAPAVITRLQGAVSEAIEWENEVNELDVALRNPIQNLRASWSGDTPPNFEIDQNAEDQNAQRMNDFRNAVAALDQQYQESIAAVTANINKIDDVMRGQTAVDIQAIAPAVTWSSSATNKQYSGMTIGSSMGYSTMLGVPKATQPNRSVQEIGRVFRDAMQSVHAFHSRYISYSWEMMDVYRRRLSALNSMRTNVESAINNVMNTPVNIRIFAINFVGPMRLIATSPIFNQTQFNALNTGSRELAYQRRLQILKLLYKNENDGDTRALNEANTFRTSLNNDNLMLNLENAGQEMWVTMHQNGLNERINAVPTEVANKLSEFNTGLTNLNTRYNAFSSAIDELYAVKARMMTTLFGMLDEYINWRTTVLRTTDNTTWRTQRANFARLMEPPVITGISFSSNKPTGQYFNDLSFSWSATHPNGVAEYAYAIDNTGGNTIITDEAFVSVGTETTQRHTVVKRSDSETQRTVAFRLMARGPGGNTAIRGVQVRVNVGTGSTYSGSGTTQGGNVLSNDTSAPAIWSANLTDKVETESTETSYFMSADPISGRPFMTPYSSTIRRIWVNETDRIPVDVVALDLESDIRDIEYAIGTSSGGTQIRSWGTMQGVRTRLGDNIATKTEATIRGLNLTSGNTYYLSVRAVNGQGLRSTVITKTFTIDTTKPTTPQAPLVARVEGGLIGGFTPPPPVNYATMSANTPVTYASPLTNTQPSIATPSYPLNWRASTDPAPSGSLASGVQFYRYILSTNRDATEASLATPEDQVRSTTSLSAVLSSGPLTFVDPFYAHIWAVDNAGNNGDALTIGPFSAPDPSVPTTPIVRAKLGTKAVYITQKSEDAESGLRGYQFAIGTTLGSTNLRPFPAENQLDLIANDAPRYTPPGSGTTFALGYFLALSDAPRAITANDLSSGSNVYVQVRSLNRQNMKSTTVSTGPFRIDTTRPQTSGITATYNRDSGDYTITVNNMSDGESGISYIEYRIINPVNSAVLQDWTTGAWWISPSFGTFSRTITRNRTADRSLLNVDVIVRISNGVGLETVSTVRVPIPQPPTYYFPPLFYTF